jgi:hypothetical protein
MVLHTPRQWNRCANTPLAITLTVKGWLLGKGMDPELLDEWCQQMGLDPAASVDVLHQPAVSVTGAEVRAV